MSRAEDRPVPTFAIARKDLRLLLRDPRSAVVLVVMPLVMMLLLGLTLGRAFGEKPDSKIRISVVNEDAGLPPDAARDFPPKAWSEILLNDLADTANIRVELIPSRAEAERLVARGDRSAVVVLGRDFSARCQRCSFVGGEFKPDPLNPLFRDGVRADELGVEFVANPGQPVGSAVIQQVVQVSLLRVVIPWMIGQAFDLIGTDRFMDKMGGRIPALRSAFLLMSKRTLGDGIRNGISDFFSEYDFNAKTWAGLTESKKKKSAPALGPAPTRSENRTVYADPAATQYQVLVPGAVVTFAFFLVLSVGWLFVAERRHGTLVRLRLAPIGRGAILTGKLLPALAVSLGQGFFLLVCGKLLFGMSWGAAPALLVPVVVSTSLAAVGLAMLVAGVARTEAQVAVYGTLLVLVLSGLSGSMLPRELLPENVRLAGLATPHAWALDAYSQLLNPNNPTPDIAAVWTACAALCGFAGLFLGLAWWRLRLD